MVFPHPLLPSFSSKQKVKKEPEVDFIGMAEFKIREDGTAITIQGLYRRKYIGMMKKKTPELTEKARKESNVIEVDGIILGVYWDSKQKRSASEIAQLEDKEVIVEGKYFSKTPSCVYTDTEGNKIVEATLMAPYVDVKSIKLAGNLAIK